MRRTRQDLGFVALKVEGGILPAEFLQKVVALEAKGQTSKDYRLPKGTTIKDEIGRAWRIASAEWREYRENSQRQDVDRIKLGVDQWLLTLFKVVLGHDDTASCSVIHVGDRVFPITHKSVSGAVPLVLTTEDFRLDKTDARFGEEGRRRSPHALMQEFLNARDECLWGIISNGRIIQLLRDNPSLTKPAYIEADLERIFEEQLYSDFAAMWLMLHGSRFACGDGKPSECFIEEWRKEGHETGERALADLRKGVTTALKELGNGFLQANQNTAIKESLKSGALSPEDYFRELLRLVYRLLFLLCVEDREQLHPSESTEQARWLYRKGYSLSRLRACALLKRNYDKHQDMWEGLQVTFQGLRKGESNLALPALGGLFVQTHCPYIEQSSIENQYLLRAVFALSFFRTGDVLARVNYRDMGTEELGSVYESLLELHPSVDIAKSPWTFEFVDELNGTSGSERKLSGSYYTPASLVDELIRSAVDPVIEDVKRTNLDNPRHALLSLKIVDPACGSGHFLLAAARRLAIEVAKLDMTSEVSEETARRHALRDVVRSCIYGVDKNELALELCKTALWIETVEPDRPLNFLDAHLLCGDSLVGILNPDVMDEGIPDEAYSVLTGDDKATITELKRRNKEDKYQYAVVQGSLFDQRSMTTLTETREAVNEMPEETLEQIEAKQHAFREWLAVLDKSHEEVKANIFVGAFFAKKTKDSFDLVPRTEDLNRIKRGMPARSGIVEACRELAERYSFFHWHLSFSEVFKKGGFDIVVGNPPWEHTELKEKEWFALRKPEIANAGTGALRKKLIDQLGNDDPSLYRAYLRDLRSSEAISVFAHHSRRYPLCGRGRINTYAIFAETNRQLLNRKGRIGCILPSGIATDDTTQLFFQDIIRRRNLVSIYDFENRLAIFPAVDRTVKFCLLTLSGLDSPVENADFVFFAHHIDDVKDPERHFTLTPEDFALVNPNTLGCPLFKSRKDAEISKAIYRAVPVFVREAAPGANPWGIVFRQGLFNMTSASDLFYSRASLEDQGWVFDRRKNQLQKDGDETFVPLYEAKMFHQFDHRWATCEGEDARDLTAVEKRDAMFFASPRFWVSQREVEERLEPSWKHDWLIVWRGITKPANERTVIASVIPRVGVGNNTHIGFVGNEYAAKAACLVSNLCSFVLDYIAKSSLGGNNLNFFILKQLPVLPPDVYDNTCAWQADVTLNQWITKRALELIYCAADLQAFARDVYGDSEVHVWDDSRRNCLKAELNAAFFHLYGVDRNAVEHILDTFRITRRKDEEVFGEFRTKRLILERFEAMADCSRTHRNYETAGSCHDPKQEALI